VLRAFHLSLTTIAGGHSAAFQGASVTRVAESFVLHLADLDLYVAMLPLATLVIVSSEAFRRGRADRDLRAFCAFTISATLWLAAASARYLVGVDPHSVLSVYDRYDFYVVPLLLIVFFFWLRSGRPAPRWTLLVALGAGGLPLLLPYSRLLYGWTISSGAVAQLPWLSIRLLTGTSLAVYPVLVAGGAWLGYLLVRSRNKDALVFAVVANLVVLNLFAVLGGSIVTRWVVGAGIGHGVERSWIDSATGGEGEVAVLWTGFNRRGSKGWYSIWESEFFNRSVGGVYDLHEPMNYRLPANKVVVRGRGGLYLATGRPLVAKYVLTDASTPIMGSRLAINPRVGMAVYRVDGPVRLLRP
jgi:hypothetical protein